MDASDAVVVVTHNQSRASVVHCQCIHAAIHECFIALVLCHGCVGIRGVLPVVRPEEGKDPTKSQAPPSPSHWQPTTGTGRLT